MNSSFIARGKYKNCIELLKYAEKFFYYIKFNEKIVKFHRVLFLSLKVREPFPKLYQRNTLARIL